MASFVNGVKTAVLRGMEAVGKGASNMATNAQQKLTEINLETRRREIISEFPMRAFDLWQKGEQLPEPLTALLQEISELDERLNVMRAQRYAKVASHDEDAEASQDAEVTDEVCAEAPADQVEALLDEAEDFMEDAVDFVENAADSAEVADFVQEVIDDSPIETVLEEVASTAEEFEASEQTSQNE